LQEKIGNDPHRTAHYTAATALELLYDLRHASASLMPASGTNAKLACQPLGHNEGSKAWHLVKAWLLVAENQLWRSAAGDGPTVESRR
jgi:hypothetical protein